MINIRWVSPIWLISDVLVGLYFLIEGNLNRMCVAPFTFVLMGLILFMVYLNMLHSQLAKRTILLPDIFLFGFNCK